VGSNPAAPTIALTKSLLFSYNKEKGNVMEMSSINNFFSDFSEIIDYIGISIIVWGFLISLKDLLFFEFSKLTKHTSLAASHLIRRKLGIYILMGLEFMIASDIIHTVVKREITDLYFLAGIIVLRTLIGYFLGKEIKEAEDSMQEKKTSAA
jgi:uncharacterized membrane protein